MVWNPNDLDGLEPEGSDWSETRIARLVRRICMVDHGLHGRPRAELDLPVQQLPKFTAG